jgi:hypothetical protein
MNYEIINLLGKIFENENPPARNLHKGKSDLYQILGWYNALLV